jgi:CRP/FNR family cyclic AMP-dependent transcriptional regulator
VTISVESLSQLPFFKHLQPVALQRIVPHMHEQTLAPGQVAVWEGETCAAVYFVVRGLVRTRRMSLNGREHVLAYLGPGECFNLVPALDGGPNPVTVDAVTATTLYHIPCIECRQILADHCDLAHVILEHLAGEVRRLSDMVESLALHSVRTRLVRFLLDYAEGRAPARQWTQEEIAAHIGTVREMVGRTMRDLAQDGLIRRERGRIVVVDRAALQREAEEE